MSASGGGTRGAGIRRSGASHASVITSLYRLSNDKETKGFGAEGVRDALNLALGALISTVERHGGDVLRIAGDALIVLFHQVRCGALMERGGAAAPAQTRRLLGGVALGFTLGWGVAAGGGACLCCWAAYKSVLSARRNPTACLSVVAVPILFLELPRLAHRPARPLFVPYASPSFSYPRFFACFCARQGGAGISRFELAELCLACTRCGWDCAASVGGDIAAGGGGGEGVGAGLSVHVGVGCGRVSCFHVGSDRLGWQLVVSGGLFEDQVRGLRASCLLPYYIPSFSITRGDIDCDEILCHVQKWETQNRGGGGGILKPK